MTKEEHVKYWRESSRHDLESAESMFESQKYDWCLFVGHLVLEKILKAIFVDKNDSNMPPKIHNLVRLAELSQIGTGSVLIITDLGNIPTNISPK